MLFNSVVIHEEKIGTLIYLSTTFLHSKISAHGRFKYEKHFFIRQRNSNYVFVAECSHYQYMVSYT